MRRRRCRSRQRIWELMRLIDEEYTRHPFYGSRRLTVWLIRQGYRVNRKRVQRLMREMGLQAVAPGPNTSRAHPESIIYPYLLRGLVIDHADQVWCADVTYIRLQRGVCVFSGGHGLVQPLCVELAVIDDAGSGILCRSAGASAASEPAHDIQYRSRHPVYQSGVYSAG